MRFTIVIAIALLCVVLGITFLKLSTPSNNAVVSAPQATTPDVATAEVLVARTDIPVGTVLTSEMVDHQPWPKNLVLEGFVTGDAKEVVGTVARADFKAREPLMLSKLAKADEGGFLAASLPKGMRAVTIGVDSETGVAGYVFPGDRVDVVLAHSIADRGRLQGTATAAEVLFPDVKVIAVGDHKNVVEGPGHARVDTSPVNVTLELSQENIAKLRLAEKNGTLSLALRPTQEGPEPVASTRVTLSSLWHGEAPVQMDSGVEIVRGIGTSGTVQSSAAAVK